MRRWQAWRPLIGVMARKMRRRAPHIPVEDFIQAGAEGLLKAIRTYQPSKGRFRPWAQPTVYRAMCDEVARLTWGGTVYPSADFPALDMQIDDYTPYDRLLAKERSIALNQAIARLPQYHRLPLRYQLAADERRWGGRTTLADAVEMKVETFWQYAAQAKQRLKREMCNL